MKKGKFIITVDTEGDNLWERATRRDGCRCITTENAKYIERFQILCQKYSFIPTYLTNYEMIMEEEFTGRAKEWNKDNLCEIGMHMHAWNCPPTYQLPFYVKGHNPYAGEYPKEILLDKLKFLTELICNKIGYAPVSHRGGRWYIDEWYIEQLIKLGYKFDCTITPGISWKKTIGNRDFGVDYKNYPNRMFYLDKEEYLLEVPPTIVNLSGKDIICELLSRPFDMDIIQNKKIWLRPNGRNLTEMLNVAKMERRKGYLEFMIHSSELMPGGSPNFRDEASIERLYDDLECLFEKINRSYVGIALKECRNIFNSYKHNANCKGKY